MPQSLSQIKKQIARLERQAEALRQKEIADVVARIRSAIEHYGLSAADLGLAPARAPRKARRAASAVKFRDAEGHTWSGHGRRPRWFVDALAAGKSADDLLA